MKQLRELAERWRERGVVHLLLANLLGPLIGFAASFAVARLLPPAEFGVVKVLQSYTNLFVIVAGAGLSAAVLKVCSEPRAEEERQGLLRAASRRAALTSCLTVVAVAVLARLGILGSADVRGWLPAYALLLPFAVLADLRLNFLNAIKRFREMASAQVVIKLETLLLVVAGTWVIGLAGYVAASIAAAGIGLTVLLAVSASTIATGGPGARTTLPAHFRDTAILSLVGNGIDVLGQNADVFLLDRLVADRARIGFYALATLFLIGATQVTATVQSAALPYLSGLVGDRAALRRMLLRTVRRSFVLGTAVAAAVYAGAFVLIPLVFGPAYAPALGYLAVLLLKYLVYSVSAITGITLFSLGLVRRNILAAAASTVVSFAVCALLLPRLGVIGAAWGQVCAALVTLGLQAWWCSEALAERG